MPALFFKQARTKNTSKNAKTPPAELSEEDLYMLMQRNQNMASSLLLYNANLRKWFAEEVCSKIPYDLVPPPTAAENLPPDIWLQGTSLQTIQYMVYYLMLDLANLWKWIVEELCVKTGLDPPSSVFDYNALSTSADVA